MRTTLRSAHSNHSGPVRARRLCLPLALVVLAGCDIAGCDQEPPAPSGELDRLGDVEIVTPPAAAGGARSFVVLTNPEIRQLRVFDVLERRFVPAPNVFFPLSARTGPATRRVAASPVDPRFVYALDGAVDLLQVVDMAPTVEVDENTVAPVFTTAAVFETGRAPTDVAVWSSGEEGDPPLAFITLPQQQAVQVLALDLEEGAVIESLLLDLGEGSHPNRVAVDPTGDAVVVTDAALDEVAIVRVRPEGPGGALAALDRRIDVGGPTSAVAIGRVDPGDGLAPVALVALRARPQLAALRLFRPGFREDRYELLGGVELPEIASALYVPDQDRESPRACCPLLSSEQDNQGPDRPTFAWAAATTPNGALHYLRFDAPRRGGGRLVRLINATAPTPTTTDELAENSGIWFPVDNDGDERRPVVEVTTLDNFGDPPVVPLLEPDDDVVLTFEGSPPATTNRRAELVDTGGGFALEVVPAAVPFAERDVRAGDEIVVDTSDRGGSCPDTVVATVEGVSGDTVALGGVGQTAAACLSQGGELRFTVVAAGDFVVSSEAAGYLGRLPVTPEGASIEVPAFRITVREGEEPPVRGDRLELELTQGLNFVVIPLGAPLPSGGFGAAALLPQAMAGGPVRIRDLEGDVVQTTRMFIATGTGGLFLLEEAAVNIDLVQAFD